jgi:hypothetical protein
MHFHRTVAIAALLGLTGTGIANAACSKAAMAGTWHFYDMQGQSPAIATKSVSVVVGPKLTDRSNVTVFKDASPGVQNDTSAVITCTLNIKANASFTGSCTSYFVQSNSVQTQSPTVTGQLNITAACAITGTINVQGDPNVVTIVAAHANGTVGAGGVASGIATQGKQVHHFTLIKG